MPYRTPVRRAAAAAGLVALAAAVGCQSDQPFRLFGYDLGNKPLYDTAIKTVYVPVFTNRALQTGAYRGLEVDLTQEVVRQIQLKTPYRVVADCEKADTELLANLSIIDKVILNRNQQNQVREADIVLVADVVWRDLRDGRVLTNPRNVPVPGLPVPLPPGAEPPVAPFDPDVQPAPPPVVFQLPAPVRLYATGRMLPEVGESNASAAQKATQKLAVQIVSMMERPW